MKTAMKSLMLSVTLFLSSSILFGQSTADNTSTIEVSTCPIGFGKSKNEGLVETSSITGNDRKNDESDSTKIICPFLNIVNPDTSSYIAFARDCEKYGMEYKMAKYVAKDVGKKQLGKAKIRQGFTPNIYNLDSVPGISHVDLYQNHFDQFKKWISDAEVNGEVTLQDLVVIKEKIAKMEQVDLMKSSKLETCLLFIAAGGDLKTWKVNSNDVIVFLTGRPPSKPIEVNLRKLNKTKRHAKWSK